MVYSINQNYYNNYFSLNSICSFGICSLSAFKISQIFAKQIHLLNLSTSQAKMCERAAYSVMQIVAGVSFIINPSVSVMVFIALYLSTIIFSRYLQNPAPSNPSIPEKQTDSTSSLKITELPDEIVFEIFKHLGEGPVERFKMLNIVADSHPKLRVLALLERAKIINDHPEITTSNFFPWYSHSQSLTLIIRFSKTYKVDKLNLTNFFSWCLKNDLNQNLETLARELPHLTFLNLSKIEFDDLSFKIISSYTNLTEPIINYITGASSVGIQSLSSLVKLTHLKMAHSNGVDDACLQTIAPKLINICHLDIRGCHKVGVAGIKALASLTNLVYLNMTDCYVLDDACMLTLAPHLSKLKYIKFNSFKVTTVGVQALASFKSLTHLKLPHVGGVNDTTLELITPHLSNLICLRISGKQLGERGVKAIAKNCLNLSKLSIFSGDSEVIAQARLSLPNTHIIGLKL